jgi:hypothetical protein
MNAPKIVHAMGHIDDDLILDAMEKQPVRNKRNQIRRFVSVAAVFVLLIGLAGFWEWRSGQSGSSMPNPLAVYAMDLEGNLTSTYLDVEESQELSEIELEIGLHGFLFSCRLDDPKEKSQLHMLNFSSTPTPNGVEALYRILEDRGYCYFYFTPGESDVPPYKITCRGDTGNGRIMTYKLLVEQTLTGYKVMVVDRSIENTGVGLWQ